MQTSDDSCFDTYNVNVTYSGEIKMTTRKSSRITTFVFTFFMLTVVGIPSARAASPIATSTDVIIQPCAGFDCTDVEDVVYSADNASVFVTVTEQDKTATLRSLPLISIQRFDISTKELSVVVPSQPCDKPLASMPKGSSRTCLIPSTPIPSPDGKFLMYSSIEEIETVMDYMPGDTSNPLTSSTAGREQLMLLELKTGQIRNLSNEFGLVFNGAMVDRVWDSNSNGIYIQSYRASDYSYPKSYLDFQRHQSISKTDSTFYAGLSQNGKFAILKAQSGSLSMKSIATGKVTAIKGIKVRQGLQAIPLNDGRNFIFYSETQDLYAGNLAGKKVLVVTAAGRRVSLARDQKSVVFQKGSSTIYFSGNSYSVARVITP
jgi:hypothetical protein